MWTYRRNQYDYHRGEFIERFSSKIDYRMNWWCYPICIKTVESNNLIYDNTPQSIAAGIIYLISGVG
jgi:hypothetical protein